MSGSFIKTTKPCLAFFILFLFTFLFLPFSFAQTSQITTYDQLLKAIRSARHASEQRIEEAVTQEKVREAWETGKLIDEHILLHKERADYGEKVVIKLAKDLGVSETELKYRIQFARTYPIRQPADELSWSHYVALLSLNDAKEREAVTREAVKKKWNRDQVREEVRKRNAFSSTSDTASLSFPHDLDGNPKLPETKPGKVGVYRMVKAIAGPYEGQLVMDLGFSNYFKLGTMDEFQEGDLVFASPVKLSKKGLASRFHFEKVLPLETREQVHILSKKNPIYGDKAMLYTYRAYLVPNGIVDGDTFYAMIDLGFGLTMKQRVRLRRLDAPELVSADGKKAKEVLEKALSRNGGQMLIQSKELDQHGRPLANVFVDGKSIDPELLESGYFQVRENP